MTSSEGNSLKWYVCLWSMLPLYCLGQNTEVPIINIWDAHRIIPSIVYVCLLNWHDMSGGDSGAFVWGGGRGVW